MEVIVAFLAGWFLSWPGLAFFLCVGTIFESNEAHGWSVFMGLVSAYIAYTMYSMPLSILAAWVAAYFVMGFIWSFWRYKRHADKIVEEYKDRNADARRGALRYLEPRQMLNSITTWVLIWPFSMVENVLGDIIKLVQTAITRFFKGIYTRIYASAVGKLMPEAETSGS